MFGQVHVIFLSAYGSPENIRKGYAAGANLFMTKPVDPERLLMNVDFTIRHERPPLRSKRHTIEQLEAIERESRPKPAPQAQAPQPPPGRPVQPPLATRPAAPAQQAPAAARGPLRSGARPRILIADDDQEVLSMLTMALGDDYEVTTAQDGIEAIERLVDCEPDLVLLDVMMPRMNGYQILQSIRRNRHFATLPVLVISAKATPRDREYAIKLGASHFLAKPFNLDQLNGLIASVVRAPDFCVRAKRLSFAELTAAHPTQAKLQKDQQELLARQREKVAAQQNPEPEEPPESVMRWKD